MAKLTIRNLEDDLKDRLRVGAAEHEHSMEEETRAILRTAVGAATGPELLKLSRQLFSGPEGVELQLPSRKGDRKAPRFDRNRK